MGWEIIMFKQSDTQKILTKFISKNPNLTTMEIADKLNLNYNSVRGRVSELKKSKLLEVNDDHEYTTIENWYKKILKTGETKNPKKSTKGYIEIYTFENNDDNRYQSLLSAALNGLLGDLDSIDNAGYSSESVGVIEVEPLYITDFDMDNPDGSWGNLTVYDWKNKNTGRVELYEA